MQLEQLFSLLLPALPEIHTKYVGMQVDNANEQIFCTSELFCIFKANSVPLANSEHMLLILLGMPWSCPEDQ